MAKLKKQEQVGRTVSTFCLTPSSREALDGIYENLRTEAKKAGDKPPSLSAIVSHGIKKLKGIKLDQFKKEN